MKDAYYFSHDSNARHDPKIVSMRSIYGYEGYGWFWAIIEILREDRTYRFPLNKFQLMGLAKQLDTNIETLQKYINDCMEIGLFFMQNDQEKQYLRSGSLDGRMLKVNELRKVYSDCGKRGAQVRWGGYNEAIGSYASKENKSKVNKIKEKEIKLKRYSPNFESIWTLYPSKVGKKKSERFFKVSVKTEEDFNDMKAALENYKNSKRVKEGFIQNGSTWFNNWKDWVDFDEPTKKTDELDEYKQKMGLNESKKSGGRYV